MDPADTEAVARLRRVRRGQCPWCLAPLRTGEQSCGLCGREVRSGKPVRCPECAYDLRGLETGPEGQRRCPECGAEVRA